VTGAARYSAEAAHDGMTYAVIVQSTIARGRVSAIDATAAKAAPGFLGVVTRENMPKLTQPKEDFFQGGKLGDDRLPLTDDRVHYAGQHLAVVVADSPERARHAASLVKVSYAAEKPQLDVEAALASATYPKQFFGEELQYTRGDVDTALGKDGLVTVKQTYTTPVETHNPMEISATVARWDGDRLTVHDATQWIVGTQAVLAEAFGMPKQNVRVVCPFVGGGFGCKGFVWSHTILAAAASKVVGRPVKLMLTRQQMFTSAGHRPSTRQTMTLAATPDGKLAALRHETVQETSPTTEHIEAAGASTSRLLYACPNVQTPHRLVKLNLATPTPMRAPGECPGTFALESAMDELAFALKIDPVQLRLANHADEHPASGKPWSSKYLRDCYKVAADAFGWTKRNATPRATRDDQGRLVGWGMATATYPGYRFPATAKVRIVADKLGKVSVVGSSATHDLGTGAYTVFTQITADTVGVPVETVQFQLGDSTLPPAPVAGGSNSTASVSQAIVQAASAALGQLAALAVAAPGSPLRGLRFDQLESRDGRIVAKNDPSKGESFAQILSRAGKTSIEGFSADPGREKQQHFAVQGESAGANYDADREKFAFQSFGCHFVEVKVDEPIARVRVTRVVSAFDVGRVINPKTTRSQALGGIVMGIGMALMEATEYDPRTGRPVTDSLADYAVPVNADVQVIDPHFIDKPDPHINTLGCRGVGEIGITGVAAAVANAVYHATGRRVRDLPIVPEKLL
jgi:xanthine dehydrogenase YagR molybdenum-binding subunit